MGAFDISMQLQPPYSSGTAAEVLAVEQLAHLIHKSPASIRSDASRNPDALPPICRLPGNKRLLWLREDVMRWLASYVQHQPNSISYAAEIQLASMTKKRGRPRKTEVRGIA